MIKRILVWGVVALVVISSAAQAQPAPPQDPVATTYRSLLSEANDRIVSMAVQMQRLEQQAQAAAKQGEKEKADAAARASVAAEQLGTAIKERDAAKEQAAALAKEVEDLKKDAPPAAAKP